MTRPEGDTITDFTAEAIPAGKYLVNPYEDWAKGEGVPIATGRTIDLMAIETSRWPRFGCRGAIAHVDGRCDFLAVFVHEIAAGEAAAPQRHVYDELCVILSGTGETEIETRDGVRVVAWGPGTVLGAPTNARYRHRNTGGAPARIAAFNDLRYLMSLYRSERFVFENPVALPATGLALSADGSGAGAGGAAPAIVLGSGTIGADLITCEPTVLRPARRQMQGAHLLGLGGDGLTRSWREGAAAGGEIELRWRHGVLAGLAGMHFHRHASAGPGAARALDIQLGSALFPMSRSRRHHYGDDTVYASGSARIE